MILIRKFITSNKLRYVPDAGFSCLYLYNISITICVYFHPTFDLSKEKKCFIKAIGSLNDVCPIMWIATFRFQSTCFIKATIVNSPKGWSLYVGGKDEIFAHIHHEHEIQPFINKYTKYYKNRVL